MSNTGRLLFFFFDKTDPYDKEARANSEVGLSFDLNCNLSASGHNTSTQIL